MKKVLFIFILFCCLDSVGQQTPASDQSESILLLGGILHIGNGDKIEGAAIGFEDGIITYIGSEKSADQTKWDRIIDSKEMHIYPGFFAMNSTLGLQEIGSVRATRDQYEVGSYNPNVRSVISFNTDSEITPTVRTNGVLLGQITPRGGTISGTSSLVQFDAWNWEDAVLEMDEGIHLNWPRMYSMSYEKGSKDVKKVDGYEKNYREITDFFESSKAYLKVENSEKNLKYEGMNGIFSGDKTLYIHANELNQIAAAVQFKKTMGIGKLVIVGGKDSWMIADFLRENDVAVILKRVHSRPSYTDEDYDLPYRIPKLLQDEGVLFCLDNSGSMEQMGTRNLPFYAGTAIAYGLTYEQGVQCLTLNAAKILGVDDQMGSLEIDKDATLFISKGDALDMKSNDVVYAFIQGREIDLDNRQKELYRKFEEKYESSEE